MDNPKTNDIPKRIAQKGFILLKIPIINMHKKTGINDHSKPNQNKVTTPKSIAGFRIKKSIKRLFSPTGLAQSSGNICIDTFIDDAIKTIHINRLNRTLLSRG